VRSFHTLLFISCNVFILLLIFILVLFYFHIALLVYVDHIVIARNDAQAISHLTNFLNYQFRVKEFGKFKYFLGFDIGRSKRTHNALAIDYFYLK
jgi:hypothetical protein